MAVPAGLVPCAPHTADRQLSAERSPRGSVSASGPSALRRWLCSAPLSAVLHSSQRHHAWRVACSNARLHARGEGPQAGFRVGLLVPHRMRMRWAFVFISVSLTSRRVLSTGLHRSTLG